MLRYRLLSAAVLIPVVLGLIYAGGLWFLGLVFVVLTIAGYEYAHLLRREGEGPAPFLVILIIWLFVLDGRFPQVQWFRLALTVSLLAAMAWAVVRFERGHRDAVVDWAWTLAGGLYLGWAGAHFVLLRNVGLSDQAALLTAVNGPGLGWIVLVLSATWFADSGAFFAGRAWGREKMSPHVSPTKTWAGYAGGVVSGTLGGAGVAWFIQVFSVWQGLGTTMTVWDGVGLGALIAMFSPLGDLGESMLKRNVGAKDSGRLIPGHGGMLDRIDSLLWAVVIGFYYVRLLAQL